MGSLIKCFDLPTGQRVRVQFPERTIGRLWTTCFRGTHLRLAGNFSKWNSVGDMISDNDIMRYFVEEFAEAMERREFGTNSFMGDCDEDVGWASTAPVGSIPYAVREHHLEEFNLNRRAKALRVKPDAGLSAPKTPIFTVVYELWNGQTPTMTVGSIYPGPDVGNLLGNVSEREGVVFFGWEHPGEA
jgi:hypothetical protein